MSKKHYFYIMFIGTLLLGLILVGENYTDLDIKLQNLFYDSTSKEWLINRTKHHLLALYFYQGPKFLMAFVGIFCIIWLFLSRKDQKFKRHDAEIMTLLLSLIFVPLIIAGAKDFTNVYCPHQLDIYDGAFPYIRILESYPANFIQTKIGKCFPAGHATVGFCYLALFYCFKRPQYRIAGLLVGLALGWTAAIYQMLRGEHFLSHSLFSCIASFMVVSTVNFFIRNYMYRTK